MILSEIRISLSLFWNLISIKDLSVEIDCCSDCYEQSSDQDSLTVLTLIITRSYWVLLRRNNSAEVLKY